MNLDDEYVDVLYTILANFICFFPPKNKKFEEIIRYLFFRNYSECSVGKKLGVGVSEHAEGQSESCQGSPG